MLSAVEHLKEMQKMLDNERESYSSELQNIIDIQIDISLKEQLFVINDLQKNPNNYEKYKLFTRYGFSNMLFYFNENETLFNEVRRVDIDA
jgi:hypothetical protein